MLRLWIAGALVATLGAAAQAQTDCNRSYVLKSGDTLLSVANEFYGERSKWSVIYYANEEALGGNLVDLPEGVKLEIPCIGEVKPKPDPTPLIQDTAAIKVLTGSDYAPFTDQSWPGNGMAYELVNAAFEETPLPFSITWENDWSKHLFPLLDSKKFDMGFPWLRPDCEAEPTNERCANFHFSDPIFDILVLLYTQTDKKFEFDKDEDIFGKTLCRPEGYFTHDLDGPDRRWLTKGLVKLVKAESPDACFKLLMDGKVDAVTLNEFLGAGKIKTLGLLGKVEPLSRPISSQSLHVIISKKHWRGTTNLYRFNAGLEKLKKTARYDEIVSRHLDIFWEQNK
jgi:polar amino acid transport system substrate-binding protein